MQALNRDYVKRCGVICCKRDPSAEQRRELRSAQFSKEYYYAAHFKEDNVQSASTLSFNFLLSIIYKKQQTLEILIKTQTNLV